MTDMQTPVTRKSSKLFGVDKRGILTVIGLTSFILMSMAAVFITFRQRMNREPVAPTAPTQSKAAPEAAAQSCTMSFTVTPFMCIDIRMFRADTKGQIQAADVGDKVEFRCAEVAGADAYKFRVVKPDGSIVTLSNSNGRISDEFTIDQEGRYIAQCRICNQVNGELQCQKFESLAGYGDVDDTVTSLPRTRAGASPLPQGCYYKQVECFQAPCEPVVICDGSADAKSCTMSWTTGVHETPKPSPSTEITPSPNLVSKLSCAKASWRDELDNNSPTYHLRQYKNTFKPGENAVFELYTSNSGQIVSQITMTDPLNTGNLNQYFTFLDSNCGAGAYNSTNRTLTCPSITLQPGVGTNLPKGGGNRIFRVKIADNTPDGTRIVNEVVVTDDHGNTVTCEAPITVDKDEPTPSPTASPAPGCNETCVTNADCDNGDHICYQNKCRLETNPTNSACLPVEPPVGCNKDCTANSDCSNTDHICYQNKCRLETNPTSSSCGVKTTTTTPPTPGASTTPVAGQPNLPAELPRTGVIEDTLGYLAIGALAIISAGAMLLLL